jgi:hypothetical protein
LETQPISSLPRLKTENPAGIRIDVTVSQPNENMVPIFTFTYMLDTIKFKEWVAAHKYTLPMIGYQMGLKLAIIDDLEKWDKTSFSFDEDGEEMFIPLMHSEVVFRVHRDLTHRTEWTVHVENPDPAAP